jgi:hypothetical protein
MHGNFLGENHQTISGQITVKNKQLTATMANPKK